MELLRLLDRFFNRALWFATAGEEHYIELQHEWGLSLAARDPDNPIRQAVPPASSEFVGVGAAF
jgi:hypothetical protein